MRRGEEFLGLLLRRIPAVLWTTDRELRITLCEGAGLPVLGLAPGEVVGKTVPEYFGGEDPSFPPLAAHRAALEGRGAAYDVSWAGRTWRVGVEPLPGGDGTTAGVIGIAVDATDAPGAAADAGDAPERRRVEEGIRRTQKMDALGRLAGGVAHDFNNLLTVISGYGDLMLARIDAASPVRRQAEEIRKAAARATELTGQLMAFSRRQVLVPRVLDLHRAIADLEETLRRLLGGGCLLEVAPGPGAAVVKVDPDQLRVVVLSLAANARDSMPDGGTLRIATRRETDRAGEWVVLEVADEGPGLSPDLVEHLFEPFYTTKERGRGSGLALAVAYGVVRQSGGHVEAESAPGSGTRIRIRLPAAAEAPASAPAPAAPAPARRGNEVILVVEDEEPIRNLVRGALEEKGYTVLVAGDGSQAMEALAARPAGVDLLLTDVVMPRMGGGELARQYRSRRPGARVLFISGFADDRLAREGISAGTEAFLRKPFAPEALVRKVREVLDG